VKHAHDVTVKEVTSLWGRKRCSNHAITEQIL